MPEAQCTTWQTLFQSLPDPRKRRGRRYPWWVLLTLVTAALASGQQHPTAMIQWVEEHADQLRQHIWERLPSGATLRRAMQHVDVTDLEDRLWAWTEAHLSPPTQLLHARALDGKTVRGAGRHGVAVHLVAEVAHGSGVVVWQQAVAEKSNEIPLVQRMLTNRSLHGHLFTMDALHTQLATTQLILRQGGHYLMVVKANQPLLYQALTDWFAEPAWPEEQVNVVKTCDVGHGRHDHRRLERRSATHLPHLWPGLQQAMRRETESWNSTTGAYRHEVTYAVTSLSPTQASAATLETSWRGHWTIENRVHYVRDVTFLEDACQVAKGNAPQVLAALRNGLLNQFRLDGWTNIAQALRHVAARVSRALRCVGIGL